MNWIVEFQCDDIIISNFCLIAIDRRINTLKSNFVTKKC